MKLEFWLRKIVDWLQIALWHLKVLSLADQLRKRGTDKQIETLSFFLTGEAKLEQYLDEHPPKESNSSDAKRGLNDAKIDLLKATGDDAKKLGIIC